ncbi:MAG: hypothetical protein FWE34_09335 [Defluviitaleaceae bacterium]|nr:hypothetical protein [Defluviitaleaceae bacterium]
MKNKLSTTLKYMTLAILTATIYGYAAYTVIYQNLADGSILHAYLWNVVFIIILLIIDKLLHAELLSDKFKVTKRNYFYAIWMYFENLISFKTTIYVFYIFILITSRVTTIDPTLVSEDFRNFVLSIEYGLILVVAFDKLMEHLFKDIVRAKVFSNKLREYRRNSKK